jgi:hypothetical protein
MHRYDVESSSAIKSRVAALKDAWLRGGEKCKPLASAKPKPVKVDMLKVHDGNENKLMMYNWNRRKPAKRKTVMHRATLESGETHMQVLPEDSMTSSKTYDIGPEGESKDMSGDETWFSNEDIADDEQSAEDSLWRRKSFDASQSPVNVSGQVGMSQAHLLSQEEHPG